ncbi:MAG TPA: hypothetical protein VM840_11835, partial [Actinomycetota bacterium]|nr:hypothetical protein [Actinomycetota bacterium]
VLWEEDPTPARQSSKKPAALVGLIAAAIVIGLVALSLLTRGGRETPAASPLPAAAVVQRGVANVFGELEVLQAEYTIGRLSVYRLPQRDTEDRATFSFSLATIEGRLVYEEPGRLRDENALQIPDTGRTRTTVVRTAEDGIRTLTVEPDDRRLDAVSGPAAGPPSGPFVPLLGTLDQAVAAPARLLVGARSVEVLGEGQIEDHRVYRVRFRVDPDPFTRADTIEMHLDAQTYFPLRVIRSIARQDAQVLGPEELLTQEAIDTAFGDRDRMTVERVDLTSVELNGVALPGEFRIEPPEDVDPETTDAGFEATTREAASEDLTWLLTPTSIPGTFREQSTVAVTEDPPPWGPRERYPAPTGVVQTTYFDGMTTVVVDQRQVRRGPFEVADSPIPDTTMPLNERILPGGEGRELRYAVSPEVPPHVWGWVDDVFVVVSGYATLDELVAFAEAMEAPEPSPTPEGSPGPSPRGSPSPTGSPRGTSSPTPRATP